MLHDAEAPHPRSKSSLIGRSRGLRGVHIVPLGFGAVLADLEFALNAGNRDAESDDAC